jgi:hypothetical protein
MRSREYRLWDDRGNSKLVVPRVLGLARDDAQAVLRSQRFEPVLHGADEHAGEVVSQSVGSSSSGYEEFTFSA